MLEGVSFAANYPRLLLALRDAAPGDLFFVQLNSPVQRRQPAIAASASSSVCSTKG
jgi:hypothetical protein